MMGRPIFDRFCLSLLLGSNDSRVDVNCSWSALKKDGREGQFVASVSEGRLEP